jgi:hypothetical protein
VAFVVLFLVGVILAGDPGTSNGVKIAEHFASDRSQILIGMWLAGVGLVAFVLWAWALRDTMIRAGEDALGALILAAGVVTVAVEFAVVALLTSLAFISDKTVDPGLARALYDSAQVFSFVDWFPIALLFAALAVAVRRTGFIASPFGWTAAALAVVSLIAAPPTFGLDMAVSLLVFAWIAAVSVLLGARSRRP